MVLNIDHDALHASAEQLDIVADNLDEIADKSASETLYDDIEDAVDKHVGNPVLNRARQLARPHVGDHAADIRAVSGEWVGDTYTAGLHTDNEVVLSHEYGSGQHSTTGPYEITPKGEDGRLAFRDQNGRMIFPKVVIHPGVRGKHFMRQALREAKDAITRDALDDAQQTIEDALNPNG